MKILLASLLAVAGCASFGTNSRDNQPFIATLTVNNERTAQIIYVMHAGYKGRRLGEVNSYSSATFILTTLDAPVAADVQFLAMSFDAGQSELSEPIVTVRGASYQWKLAPGHGNQYASVQYAPVTPNRAP